jgi:membrane protease YdiL (CAAX protease family)
MSANSYPNFIQALKLIGLCMLILIPVSFIGKVLIPDEALLSLFTYVIVLTIIIMIGYRKKNRVEGGSRLFSKEGFNISTAILLLLTILSIQYFLDPVFSILPKTWLDEFAAEHFANAINSTPISILSIVVAPAIFEELLFRGIILNGFLRIYKTRNAILLSALLFGLIHLNVSQFFGGFTAGLLLGWVYTKTGSIIYCVIMHAFNNLFCHLYYLKFGETDLIDLLGRQLYITSVLMSLALFIILIFYLKKRFADKLGIVSYSLQKGTDGNDFK